MENNAPQLNTPILLWMFNRPETTRKVFEKIREVRPKQLFVSADGPRPDHPNDKKLCAETRAIIDGVDWECEIHKNFYEKNITSHAHWPAAIGWFFKNVERGIILEDDCVPNMSFFMFCEKLLEKYKNNEKIMHINGSNFQFGQKRGDGNYYFSKYSHSWGWATWKRAWNLYDDKMSSFPDFKKNNTIESAVKTEKEEKYWLGFFEKLFSGRLPFCDAKWLYAIWSHDGICITPNINMVTNIGYGSDATQTISKDKTMGQDAQELENIIDPINFNVDYEADKYAFKLFHERSFFQKASYRLKKLIYKIF